ncbi:MAG: hypothetical protein K8T90_07655 [Planctomycetes bacterium]|nr:hypothetical protein [Planctomycetota bacterium]
MLRHIAVRAVLVASVAALGVAAVVTLAPGSRVAFAETKETDAISLGALTERAGMVALVRVLDRVSAGGPEGSPTAGVEVWRVHVEEALRVAGSATLMDPPGGGDVDVAIAVGRAPVAKGGTFLAFLQRTERGWSTLELPWAFRTTAEPGVAALVEYTRGYALRLGPDNRAADAEAMAAHLVAGLASSASGVPFSAGRDLLRHDEVQAALTPAHRAQLTAALAVPRKSDDDFASIVLAAGRLGGPGTDDVLVDRLMDTALRPQRRNVVSAMAHRASSSLVSLLAARLAAIRTADAAQPDPSVPSGAIVAAANARRANRADIANALGRIARPECESPLLELVADTEPAVRVEAAHGLGLLARAVREPQPSAAPGAAPNAAPNTAPNTAPDAPRAKLTGALEPLVALATRAATENERLASTWALGQIDTQPAWDALRKLAKDHPEPRVRDLARQILERPRVALLLAGE